MKTLTFYFDRTDLKTTELASKLQGFLMSRLDTDYVAFLHQQATNPYAMTVQRKGEEQVWRISLLTAEAIEQILPAIQNLDVIELATYAKPIRINRSEIENRPITDLVEGFYQDDADDILTIRFYTPTSFKSQGDYSIFPDLFLMYQNLMLKYARLIEQTDEIDFELLDSLVDASRIVSYDLKTWYFPVHTHRIPAFQGRIRLRLKGATSLKAYIKFLFKFGEYAGLGIKTSLGMGGIRIETDRT